MNFDYLITEENRLSICDEISEHIGEFCGQYLKENRDVLRYRLSAEEYLLKWLNQDSIGKTLTLSCTKRMFTPPAITMTMSGDPQNPVGTGNGDDSYSLGVLRSLGIGPTYSYSEGKNILQFDARGHSDRKIPVFFGVIAGALLVGILGNLFIPADIKNNINDIILTPVYDLFLKLLSLVSGPLIFLSVTWGIYGIGDTASFSRIGKSVIVTFIRNTFLACFGGLALASLFDLTYSESQVSLSQTSELISLIFGCVPKNIVEPFFTGNTLQIIFLAVAVGICLIYLGKKTAGIAKGVEEINLMLQYIMEFISKLVPGLIFIVIVSLFWSGLWT